MLSPALSFICTAIGESRIFFQRKQQLSLTPRWCLFGTLEMQWFLGMWRRHLMIHAVSNYWCCHRHCFSSALLSEKVESSFSENNSRRWHASSYTPMMLVWSFGNAVASWYVEETSNESCHLESLPHKDFALQSSPLQRISVSKRWVRICRSRLLWPQALIAEVWRSSLDFEAFCVVISATMLLHLFLVWNVLHKYKVPFDVTRCFFIYYGIKNIKICIYNLVRHMLTLISKYFNNIKW